MKPDSIPDLSVLMAMPLPEGRKPESHEIAHQLRVERIERERAVVIAAGGAFAALVVALIWVVA